MNNMTIVGNLGQEPELRFTQAGKAVISFSVGTTHLKGADKQKETTWHECVAFGEEAENIAASFHKGSRVIVIGRLERTSYEKNGQKQHRTQIVVNEAALSVRYDPATSEKGERTPQTNTAPQYGDDAPF